MVIHVRSGPWRAKAACATNMLFKRIYGERRRWVNSIFEGHVPPGSRLRSRRGRKPSPRRKGSFPGYISPTHGGSSTSRAPTRGPRYRGTLALVKETERLPQIFAGGRRIIRFRLRPMELRPCAAADGAEKKRSWQPAGTFQFHPRRQCCSVFRVAGRVPFERRFRHHRKKIDTRSAGALPARLVLNIFGRATTRRAWNIGQVEEGLSSRHIHLNSQPKKTTTTDVPKQKSRSSKSFKAPGIQKPAAANSGAPIFFFSPCPLGRPA